MNEELSPIFSNSSVNSALTRVRNTLEFSLESKYGIQDPEVVNKFLKMHGLSKDHFDFINNFERLIEKGIADNSVDTNANKGETSITGLFAEAALPINKLVGYRYLYRKMKDMYGKKRAKFLAGEMYDMSLALADSTNILKPYCFAVNASKLVLEGRPWGSLPSLPPRHLSSYIHCLCEVIHQLSNHTAGALAIGSFFLDLAHMLIYRDHKTLTDLKDPEYKKYIENNLQSFVHSMNHLSRNSVESPFTNVSIFDRPKFRALIAEDNMGWYFAEEDLIDGVPINAIEDCKAQGKEWKEYVIDVILELEDAYMNVMDRGDLMHDGRPITFPVSTINISRKPGKKYDWAVEDPEFLDYICKKHDIMRYNIYISEGMKVASCCHDYKNYFYYEDPEGNVIYTPIGAFVDNILDHGEQVNEKHLAEGLFYVQTPTGRASITGVLRIPNEYGELVVLKFSNKQILKVTPNHEFQVTDKSEQKVLRTALEIFENSSEYSFGENLILTSIEKISSDKPVYDIEINSEDHLYKIGDIITHNCRLINDFDLFELGGQVNSFGGSGLSLGSHRVVTINLRRIALECDSWEDYKVRLKERMNSAADILLAHKELIKDMTAKGTQPFIDNGWLDLSKMFSTFGILGYYEAAKDMQKRFDPNYDYLSEMVAYIDELSREFSKEKKNVFNVEEIPGESMAYKLPNTDRWIFGEEKVSEPLYANQFVPLWEETTLHEKFEREGQLGAQLTGGGIAHYSLGEKLTGTQTRKVIEEALRCGMEHWALNPTYAICENDHFVFGKHQICPKCGGKIVDNLTRTVGFFIRTSNMTTVKREEDYEKRHYDGV